MPWIDLLLNLLFSALGTLGICLAGLGLAWFVGRRLRVKADREHALRLKNQGNCASLYYLEVNSPEPRLRFSVLFNQLPLAGVYLPAEAEKVRAEPSLPGPAQAEPNKQALVATSGVETAAKAGQSVASVAGKSASWLETLGKWLPGSSGRLLKQQSAASRKVQVTSLRAARAPQTLRRQVGGFQKTGQGRNLSTSPASKAGQAENTCLVQTPIIEPGQVLDLSLQIGAARGRHPQGSFPYTLEILPRAVDFPELPATPSLKNGTVYFKPVSAWRSFLPFLSTLTLTLLTITALVIFYRFIWL